MEITQDRINKFAEATGDEQWIHVDTERAARESPEGLAFASGFLVGQEHEEASGLLKAACNEFQRLR